MMIPNQYGASRHTRAMIAIALAVTVASGSTTAASAPPGPPGVQLKADSTTFLANIDDDAGVCKSRAVEILKAAKPREEASEKAFDKRGQEILDGPGTNEERQQKYFELQRDHRRDQYQTERELAACNDAADTVVNGARDEADLTRLRTTPWPNVPAGVTGTITANTTKVRLFVKRNGWELVSPATRLTAAELRKGVEFGLEGLDVVRDRAVWDGRATITLAAGGQTSSVELKVAPVLTQDNTQPVQDVLLAQGQYASAPFIAAMEKAVNGGVKRPIRKLKVDDEWVQDILEPAYATTTDKFGKTRGMRVLIPSVNAGRQEAGRLAFTELAGPDVAAIHIAHELRRNEDDSLNSMGNLETLPPRPGFPAGQIVLGGDTANPLKQPAPEMLNFLRAQGVQDPLLLDVSWLEIGHVDEFLQVVPAPGSPRGWRVLIADPQAGLQMLKDADRDGHGDLPLHGDLPKLEWPYEDKIESRTIKQMLADKQFVKSNTNGAEKVAAMLGVLRAKTGLTDADIIRVPVLPTYKHLNYWVAKSTVDTMPPGPEKEAAQAELETFIDAGWEVPDAVNGLVLNNGVYVAPKQYGPIIGGKAIFAESTRKALRRAGFKVRFVNNLVDSHVSGGEIHCVTNTLRKIPGL
ncbi:protein-arginine deiminase family protein [Kribbella deserti]|uniref:Protein-arginine deiminase family protein n=1 Tax=Kribbella deserti TaxID=1926257 RepID=A0ABV6QNR6_9ACTN